MPTTKGSDQSLNNFDENSGMTPGRMSLLKPIITRKHEENEELN
jgi:hypothetical protein